MTDFKKTVENLLETVGVQINGPKSWDMQIHNEDFYSRVLSGGALALGESYMDGWWDCEALDQFMDRLLGGRIDEQVKGSSFPLFLVFLRARFLNSQSQKRAYIVAEKHYDTGNNLFSLMLDKRMNYSCGYWKNAENLDQAQENKLDLICRKLNLEPGMSVLEIGCGWGAFVKFAAENYDVSVHGITISQEQKVLAEEICKGQEVTFELKDYRELDKEYDRIVSIGMFEHVGYKNYRIYMEVVNRCLKDDGLFLLHTIGRNSSDRSTDSWTNKYIFPNGMTPSSKQVSIATEGIFQIEDWHSFGQYYDKTLMAWHDNFQKHWPELQVSYDERFRRMWCYYLLTAAASFRSRRNQLWQLVLSKHGVSGGYSYKNNPRFEQGV